MNEINKLNAKYKFYDIHNISYKVELNTLEKYQKYDATKKILQSIENNEYGIKKADIKNDIAYIDGVEISLDSIINDIINDARYGGMSDAEINLGLSDLVGKSLANQYLNVSIDEKVGVKTKAYHEWKASLYYLDDNRGVSR